MGHCGRVGSSVNRGGAGGVPAIGWRQEVMVPESDPEKELLQPLPDPEIFEILALFILKLRYGAWR